MLVLSNHDVEQVLDFSVCVEALETGYRDLASEDDAYTPLTAVYAPSERSDGLYCVGTGGGVSRSMGVYTQRIKSDVVYSPDGKTEEKYALRPGKYCGLLLVFSIKNGEPLAVLQDGFLQHMRTAGTAAIGANHLAREDASVVGVVGTGGMAKAYIEAFAQIRPLTRVKVFSPEEGAAETCATEVSRRLGVPVEPSRSLEEVMRAADIVATCTNSAAPLTIDPSWIVPGMHLTNVNPHEWNASLLKLCNLVVRRGKNSSNDEEITTDHRSGYVAFVAGREAKNRVPRSSPGSRPTDSPPTLTDVLAGKTGRTSPEEITFFYNCEAHILGFAPLAGKVWELAKAQGLGQEFPTDWLIEDIRD